MAKELKDLTKRADNYSQWYNDLVVKADLAEQDMQSGKRCSSSLTECLRKPACRMLISRSLFLNHFYVAKPNTWKALQKSVQSLHTIVLKMTRMEMV